MMAEFAEKHKEHADSNSFEDRRGWTRPPALGLLRRHGPHITHLRLPRWDSAGRIVGAVLAVTFHFSTLDKKTETVRTVQGMLS